MNVDLPKRKLFVVSFGVFEHSGHFFNEVLGYREAARNLGMDAHIYLGSKALPHIVEELRGTALLPDMPFSTNDRDTFVEEIARAQRGLEPVWDRLESSGISDGDIIAVTSPRALAIYAFGLWLSRLPPAKRPAIFVRFSPQHIFDFAERRFVEAGWTYRFAARAIDGLPGGDRVYFSADSKLGVQLVERLSGRTAHLLGVPMYYGDGPIQVRPATKTTSMYVHCSRGGLMPQRSVDIIRTLLTRRADIAVRLRICKHLSPDDELMVSVRGALEGFNVELLPSQQSARDFLDVIDSCDILLLPYDLKEYEGIISGPFCEATAKGKISIVAAGTWMAEEIAEGRAAGVVFANSEPGCVADAIERAIDGRHDLLARAAHLAGAMRATNSCEGSLRRMIELSAAAQEIRLPYVPEQRLSAAGPRLNLGPGWSQIESGFGVWSDGESAELHFRIRPSKDPLIFEAEVNPYITPSHPRLTVAFSVSGTLIASWEFDFADDENRRWSRRSVLIPAELTASGDFKLVLEIRSPASPLELGLSEDRRRLGIAMRTYALTPSAAGHSRANVTPSS